MASFRKLIVYMYWKSYNLDQIDNLKGRKYVASTAFGISFSCLCKIAVAQMLLTLSEFFLFQ